MHTPNLAKKVLRHVSKKLYGAKIAAMGLAYKKNINDPRELPIIKIIEELVNVGAGVRVYDPFVPLIRTKAGVSPRRGASRRSLRQLSVRCFWWTMICFPGEIPLETINGLMASPVFVDGKNLFEGGAGMGKGI